MTHWKIAGLIATLIIVLSVPAYMLKEKYFRRPTVSRPGANFVGGKKCMDCHRAEYDKWQNSHHDNAMDVASDATVLGDFDNAVVKFHGVTSRFYRKNNQFFVYTQGPDGKMGEFEITHPDVVVPVVVYGINEFMQRYFQGGAALTLGESVHGFEEVRNRTLRPQIRPLSLTQ